MVDKEEKFISIISLIHDWIDRLPPVRASFSEEDLEYEHVISIRPNNPRASEIELRIGKKDKTFDVSLGQNVQFDDMELSDKLIIIILDCVKMGRLKEVITEKNDNILGSKGELYLFNETWYSNRKTTKNLVWKPMGKKNKKVVKYEHW